MVGLFWRNIVFLFEFGIDFWYISDTFGINLGFLQYLSKWDMHHTGMHYCMIETPWTEPPPCPNPPSQMCGKEQAVCILLECMNYLGCISDKVGITSENFGCISDAFRTVFRTVFWKKVTWYECCNLIGSEDFASPPDAMTIVTDKKTRLETYHYSFYYRSFCVNFSLQREEGNMLWNGTAIVSQATNISNKELQLLSFIRIVLSFEKQRSHRGWTHSFCDRWLSLLSNFYGG